MAGGHTQCGLAEPIIAVVRINVIGCDAGAPHTLPHHHRQLVAACEGLVAPRRLLGQLAEQPSGCETCCSDDLHQALEMLQRWHGAGKRCVVLASGDPLWFGIGRTLLQRFPADDLCFHPAATSLQQLFARLKRPWQDVSWASLHGRDDDDLRQKLRRWPAALVVLTDPGKGGVAGVAAALRNAQLGHRYDMWVAERLGHPQERLRRVQLDDLPSDIAPLNLVLLLRRAAPHNTSRPRLGMDDGLWQQYEDHPGLMTKREIRVLLLAELDPPPRGVLWDLGAGVGSVAIEAMGLSPGLDVHAVERRIGAEALIRRNAVAMGCNEQHLHVYCASASAVLAQLPDPDRVLIGGGGDRLQVLQQAAARLRPGGRIVIPLATLEAFGPLQHHLKQAGLVVQSLQALISRGSEVGGQTRLQPLNPVTILTGRSPVPAAN